MSYKPALRLFLALGFCVALPVMLAGCDTLDMDDEATPAKTAETSPPPQNVQQTPPGIQPEAIPVIPDPQAEIWRPGYWAMSDGVYVWVPGKVIPRPSPTAVWATAYWMHHQYGWSFQEGHWE